MVFFLQTIDEAWPGSSKIAEYAEHFGTVPAPGYSWPTTILVLFMVFYCILYFNRIVLASSLSLNTFFNSSDKIQNICENQTSLSAVNRTSVICLPVILMLVYTRGWTSLSLAYLCAAFIAYLLVRVLCFAFIGWYKGTTSVFDTIRNSGRVTLVATTLLSLPAFVIPMLFGEGSYDFAKTIFFAVVSCCYAMYCARACKYLLEAGFSIFFCFLYLCAFEFLPAGLLIGAIISL
ncbi:MAG: DUF4271 domain-containing protein [Bacteroidales bacterium]|nr:DUF4271 domain-containing protein [Bacteroidales bacterium]